MQRLIEQLVDEGDVLEQHSHIGRVHYHLAVYQHFSDKEGEPVPSHVEVEGHVTPIDELTISEIDRKKVELTLSLADGRFLDFRIVQEDGAIHSTGRGLYRPD